MIVTVKLFANLADHLPGGVRGVAPVELPPGATVAALIRQLALPEDVPRLVLVNGVDASPGHRLAPGDEVTVLPPLVGG